MRDLIRANAGLLLAGVASYVMMGAGQSMYGPALPAFARDLGLADAQAAWLISAHWVGCALGVGFMYVRATGVTPRMTAAVMAMGAALVAMGIGVVGTFLGALVFGAGYGAATVVFNPRVLRAFGARGTSMLSLLNASFGIGAIAAPLVFVWLGSAPELAFGVVAVLAALVWVFAGPAGRNDVAPQARPDTPFRPRYGLLSFAVLGIGLEACLIGLGPTALIAAGVAEEDAARRLSAFFVTFLGARVALVFGAHLVAPFTLYLWAMALMGAFCAMAALFDPGVFFMLVGAPAAVIFPCFYVAASRVMGDDPRVPATIIAAGLIGGIAAPVLIGPAMADLGERGFFWVIAGVAGVVALAGLLTRRRLPDLARVH